MLMCTADRTLGEAGQGNFLIPNIKNGKLRPHGELSGCVLYKGGVRTAALAMPWCWHPPPLPRHTPGSAPPATASVRSAKLPHQAPLVIDPGFGGFSLHTFRQICCIGLKPAALCTVVCLNLKKNPRRLHNLMEETSHSPSLTVPGCSA